MAVRGHRQRLSCWDSRALSFVGGFALHLELNLPPYLWPGLKGVKYADKAKIPLPKVTAHNDPFRPGPRTQPHHDTIRCCKGHRKPLPLPPRRGESETVRTDAPRSFACTSTCLLSRNREPLSLHSGRWKEGTAALRMKMDLYSDRCVRT